MLCDFTQSTHISGVAYFIRIPNNRMYNIASTKKIEQPPTHSTMQIALVCIVIDESDLNEH
jgi:hypothetical protein